MDLIQLSAAVFIGNMITVAWAYSMNHIIKASNEGRPHSLLALWGVVATMLFAAGCIAIS